MTQTKTCPACRKEIPIQAVRCKHCGIRFTTPPSLPAPDENSDAPTVEQVAVPGGVRRSVPPPPPPSRAGKYSMPPPVLGFEKRPLGEPKVATEPPTDEHKQRDTGEDYEDLVSEATAGMVVDKEEQTQEITIDDISEVVSTEKEEAESADTDEAASSSSFKSTLKPTIDKATKAISKTASQAKQRISMAPEAIGAIKEKVSVAPEKAKALKEKIGKIKPPPESISFLNRKLLDDGTEGPLGMLRIFHVAIAALALLVILIGVIVVSFGDDEKDKAEASFEIASKAPDEDKPKEQTEQSPPEPKKEEPVVENCRPFAEYPKFPWYEYINKLIEANGLKGICGLASVSSSQAAASFESMNYVGPTGYDLIENGEILKVFPKEQTHRLAPSMSFIFVGGKLYEIHLDYKELFADDLPLTLFEKKFKETFEKHAVNDNENRTNFSDGDTIAQRVQKTDIYKRVFNKIVFASKAIREGLGENNLMRWEAEADLEKGIELMGQSKHKEAISMFQKAREKVADLGAAYIWEGIVCINKEQFQEAEKQALKALAVTNDCRAKAEAKGLMAVAALYKGEKDRALELFGLARDLDPTNSEFESSTKELETGEYDPKRVAKTKARLHCLKKRDKGGTERGILARGNFPSMSAYEKAAEAAAKSDEFKSEVKRWIGWVCP